MTVRELTELLMRAPEEWQELPVLFKDFKLLEEVQGIALVVIAGNEKCPQIVELVGDHGNVIVPISQRGQRTELPAE